MNYRPGLPSGEDDDGDIVFATFSRAQVYQVLLKIQAVLIRNLEWKRGE